MSTQAYRHNHYVPVWYQRRFMLPGQRTYHYLDLKPEIVVNNEHRYARRALLPWGPDSCFAQNDLYTVQWGTVSSTEIEQFFFGQIDSGGRDAVEAMANFRHHESDHDTITNLLTYMSVQKLRTPKGLGWLAEKARATHRNLTLLALQALQRLYGTIWAECVWQIADATQAQVKFIISDHPVTVYNRGCFPGSPLCTGFNDPDIRMVGSHTYFPLGLEKVLILTNLAWVRNPYQHERNVRPHPNYFRNSIFKLDGVQLWRTLTEEEVLQINYITKKRAFRYVAAAKKEWLYPESHLASTQWGKFGQGYLLMPEPRDVHMGGQIYIGYGDGRHDAFDEYGHKPWHRGYDDKDRYRTESASLRSFQAEFAAMQGPAWRGTSASLDRNGPFVDSEELHRELMQSFRRPGRRQR
jgi:hypothetical protein